MPRDRHAVVAAEGEGQGWMGSRPGERDAYDHGLGVGILVLLVDGHCGVGAIVVLVAGAAMWKTRRGRGCSPAVSVSSPTIVPPPPPDSHLGFPLPFLRGSLITGGATRRARCGRGQGGGGGLDGESPGGTGRGRPRVGRGHPCPPRGRPLRRGGPRHARARGGGSRVEDAARTGLLSRCESFFAHRHPPSAPRLTP